MIGLGLGRLKDRLDSGKQVVIDSVQDIQFVEGGSKLVYTVLFNLLSSYNAEKNTGSKFLAITKNIVLVIGKPEFTSAAISDELENVKNRIRYSQQRYMQESGIILPNKELLRDIQVLNITPDEIRTEVIIDIKIIDEDGRPSYITV